MKFDKSVLCLYGVTDRSWTGNLSLYEQVEAALRGGMTCVQLREKHLTEEAFLLEALEISGLCQKYNVPLIINDNVEVALRCHADGIHVGQEDMKTSDIRKLAGNDIIIGVSAHTVEEAVEAEKAGADYLGLGAVFPTSTKTDVGIMTASMLREICDAVRIPCVAIGGIQKENILSLSGSGVAGIAVVSALFGAQDTEAAAKELRQLTEEMIQA